MFLITDKYIKYYCLGYISTELDLDIDTKRYLKSKYIHIFIINFSFITQSFSSSLINLPNSKSNTVIQNSLTTLYPNINYTSNSLNISATSIRKRGIEDSDAEDACNNVGKYLLRNLLV